MNTELLMDETRAMAYADARSLYEEFNGYYGPEARDWICSTWAVRLDQLRRLAAATTPGEEFPDPESIWEVYTAAIRDSMSNVCSLWTAWMAPL